MALLNATQQKTKRKSIVISIDQLRMEEIKAYCAWAGIDRLSNFILQAVDYVLKNDKDWRKNQLEKS